MKRFPSRLCVGAVLSVLALYANAQEPALIQGPNVTIDGSDMRADSLRMPPEMRDSVLSRPQTVTQIASNLYARRAMAQRAEASGLEKDSEVAAALRIARDKVLSDAYLAKMDKDKMLSDSVAEGIARNIYKAKPERFKTPEQVQVRHILIAGSDADARAQIEKIRQELKTGADFAQLAKDRSADKGSAAKGGDLGFFEAGKMVPEFDKAAFALTKPGELSDIVQSKFGYHILQLQGRNPARTRTFDEAKDELVQEVRNNAQQEARVADAQALQKEAKINKEAIEAFAAGYAPKPAKAAP
ncbi:peptidylprolyl isomerase [Acidovorax sp. GBBC 3334]|uniref:peptidylprolyl isomerase n=1 Tax=Acidovorax sp. GBBC 3334 TaxID=2940496 RepID=UPI002302CA15|nr:peptidylprolyl isomerase [Acidovorax sp. GBBC 3334]MDA8453516.1 peptidylprolyl isomerase [Acidovorax sp. GBBC 3334]